VTGERKVYPRKKRLSKESCGGGSLKVYGQPLSKLCSTEYKSGVSHTAELKSNSRNRYERPWKKKGEKWAGVSARGEEKEST